MVKKILNFETFMFIFRIITVVTLSIAVIYLKHKEIDLSERLIISEKKVQTLETINEEILTELVKLRLGGKFPHMKKIKLD